MYVAGRQGHVPIYSYSILAHKSISSILCSYEQQYLREYKSYGQYVLLWLVYFSTRLQPILLQ